MRKQGIGLRAEYTIAALLSGPTYGRSVVRCSYNSPHDLVVDGLRAEIKCAAPQKDGVDSLVWKFNIHRHGALDEARTDIYILRLEEVPYSRRAIHMLLKAPIGKLTIDVSIRELLNQRFAAEVADFYALARGEYGRKEVAA